MGTPRITRRGFLGATAAAAAATAAGGAALAWRNHQSSGSARNAILIITDSMRRDTLGCYGGNWVKTPQLDAFAARAVRFDNAYLCSFPTVLARNDMLTGKYTFTFKPWEPLDRAAWTLPVMLHQCEVYSALFADNPHPYTRVMNYQRGFDHAEVIRGQEGDPFILEPDPSRYPCLPSKLRDPYTMYAQYMRNISIRKSEEDWFCPQTMRKAASWLEANHKRQPFFLYVDTYDPHEPWDPPRYYTEMYDPGYVGEEVTAPRYDLWETFLTPRELEHCRALYAGEATMVDRWVGHLLETIERLGLLENTMVIHISDHGVMLGEHGYIGKTIRRLVGEQMVYQGYPLYPELSRVPMIVHYPGCRPGSALPALAQPVNVPATVLDYMGLPIPPAFDGPSLWPVLQGHAPSVADRVISAPILAPLRNKIPFPTNQASICDGRWMLVYSCAGWADELDRIAHRPAYKERRVAPFSGRRLDPQLFDLQSDPRCLTNVYPGHRELALDMHRWFYAFLQQSPMRRDHLPYFAKLENT